jgi:DNA modification methylase
MIQASSDRGDLVGDFFCGSGTTLVTAKRLGRHWLGCDRSSEAVKLTRKRLAQPPAPCQTGRRAIGANPK